MYMNWLDHWKRDLTDMSPPPEDYKPEDGGHHRGILPRVVMSVRAESKWSNLLRPLQL